jgi:hypothetical protein
LPGVHGTTLARCIEQVTILDPCGRTDLTHLPKPRSRIKIAFAKLNETEEFMALLAVIDRRRAANIIFVYPKNGKNELVFLAL